MVHHFISYSPLFSIVILFIFHLVGPPKPGGALHQSAQPLRSPPGLESQGPSSRLLRRSQVIPGEPRSLVEERVGRQDMAKSLLNPRPKQGSILCL